VKIVFEHQSTYTYTGWSKKRIPSFTVTSRNLWRVNVKFFHPPHLYCVTTLLSKTNTTVNIGHRVAKTFTAVHW